MEEFPSSSNFGTYIETPNTFLNPITTFFITIFVIIIGVLVLHFVFKVKFPVFDELKKLFTKKETTSESNDVVPESNVVVPESNVVVPESNVVVPESNVVDNNITCKNGQSFPTQRQIWVGNQCVSAECQTITNAPKNLQQRVIIPKEQIVLGKNFSILCWIKVNSGSTGNWYNIIHKAETIEQETLGLWLRPEMNLHARIITNSNSKEGINASKFKANVGQWFHFAWVQDGKSMKIYINGSLSETLQLSGEPLLTQFPLQIPSEFWELSNIDLDKLEFCNQVLPSEAIDSEFNSNRSQYNLDQKILEFTAKGDTGAEIMKITANNSIEIFKSSVVSKIPSDYKINVPISNISTIEFHFLNDGLENGIDRNINITSDILFDGKSIKNTFKRIDEQGNDLFASDTLRSGLVKEGKLYWGAIYRLNIL